MGLPYVVVKYGGSICWALLIYWIVSAFVGSTAWAAWGAGCVATGIEFFKRYHSPGMDAFRLTVPGMLILGRYFSWWDLLAYWVAIALGVVLDLWLRGRRTENSLSFAGRA